MAKKQAAAKTTDELVQLALKAAATKPKANWSGASGAVLFSTKEVNHAAAIEECTKSERPLLVKVGKNGALTAEGFERIAHELSDAETHDAYERLIKDVPEERIGSIAKLVATRIELAKRVEFVQETIRRTPLAAAELISVLEEATAAEKAEQEARITAAKKRAEAEAAAIAALERAKVLFEERRKNRLDALCREWEAIGEEVSDLPPHIKKGPGSGEKRPEPGPDFLKKPVGADEKNFFRQVARRLVSAWLEAVRLGKNEARGFLQVVFSNLHTLEQIGNEGEKVAFDGSCHQSESGVSTGASVTVVRPGWKLIEDEGEYVIESALVKP